MNAVTTDHRPDRSIDCGSVFVSQSVPDLLGYDVFPRLVVTVPSVWLKGMLRIPPELSGLERAIRWKTELLQRLVTSAPAEWPEQLAQFITSLESSDLQDTTALLVLLADLRAQMRLLSVACAAAIEPDVTSTRWPADESGTMSSRDVLGWFREELITSAVRVAQGHVGTSILVLQAATFINEHYAEPLTLEGLASAVGHSKRHLATCFRQETGRTVHDQLAHVRVRHALALILRGEKIEAVSQMVGYKSKKNFYHQFKKIIGVTPIAYRTGILRLGASR